MRNLKIMIVEADSTEVKRLLGYLNKIGLDYACLSTDAASIINYLKCEKPLLLLVNLNEQDSQEKINSNDYLAELESISSFTLISNKNLEKIFQQKKQTTEPLNGTKDSTASQRQVKGEVIFVKIGKVFKQILLADIDYIFYEDRHANLKIANKNIPVKISMREFAQRLPSEKFIQIHQAHIINILKVTQIDLSNNQVEIQGKWLPIGTKFFKKFKETISIFY